MNVAIFSSVLNRVGDEGVRNFAGAIGREWQKQKHNLLWVNLGEKLTKGEIIAIDPWLRPWKIPLKVKEFRPDLVAFYPDASLNIFSALRSRALHAIFPSAKHALIALQPEPHLHHQVWCIRLVKGFDRLFVQSQHSVEDCKGVSRSISVIPSGVDRLRFQSVNSLRKRELRQKYQIQSNLPLALHVGHLRHSRNIEKLLLLQKNGIAQLILVGSTSTTQDLPLIQRFKESGVIVIDYYLEHIEEWYQMADLYVFPVISTTSAIEFPLSVLEALACGLPIVSTPFGGLPDFLSQKDGIIFTPEDKFVEQVSNAINNPIPVPLLRSDFEWGGIARRILMDMGFSIKKTNDRGWLPLL